MTLDHASSITQLQTSEPPAIMSSPGRTKAGNSQPLLFFVAIGLAVLLVAALFVFGTFCAIKRKRKKDVLAEKDRNRILSEALEQNGREEESECTSAESPRGIVDLSGSVPGKGKAVAPRDS